MIVSLSLEIVLELIMVMMDFSMILIMSQDLIMMDDLQVESLGLLIVSSGTLISGSVGLWMILQMVVILDRYATSSVVDGITLPDGTVGESGKSSSYMSDGSIGVEMGYTPVTDVDISQKTGVWARPTSGTATAIIDV